MKIEKIDVSSAINKAKALLKKEKSISPPLRIAIELLIKIITILLNQKTLNSRNSSQSPSQDPHRPRDKKTGKSGTNKIGGQRGHTGSTLEPVDTPDEVQSISIDRRTLPSGHYTPVGFEKRQVFDVKISLHVTEYQGEILEDSHGNRWFSEFPEGVDNPTQYGSSVKAHSVYMSQFQLIPHLRVANYFNDQLGIPLSSGSVYNFNELAFKKLELFEEWVKETLLNSPLNHADETSVNIKGKKFWFHLLSNDQVVLYQVDEKRGKAAMDRMGILPEYQGIVCHDHWGPYYTYSSCTHALCNAHHLRELQRAWEQDKQHWAKEMKTVLEEMNKEVHETDNKNLSENRITYYQDKYRDILSEGEKECPLNKPKGQRKKKGRVKQSKARNLLDRLRNFEGDTLRFIKEPIVPFTNNTAENDLRMTKVQQKISGCFRSLDGAKIFCRTRSFLLTCQKNGEKPTEALNNLFQGKLPSFVGEKRGPPTNS